MKQLRLLMILLAGLVLCACNIFREETATGLYAPEINPKPADGMVESRQATLYFPMADSSYMCSQKRTVEFNANQPVENALLNELLVKGPESPTDLVSVLDNNIIPEVERNSSNDSIIEITLPSEFMGNSMTLTGSNAQRKRRISLYCIVNTLTQYDRSLRVKFYYIDNNDSKREFTYESVGMTPPQDGGSTLPELYSNTDNMILTPYIAITNVLNAAQSNDAATLYRYLITSGGGPESEAQLADIMIKSPRVIWSEPSVDWVEEEDTARINVELKRQWHSEKDEKYVEITLKKAGDVWKVGYADIEKIIFETGSFTTEESPDAAPDSTDNI